MPAKDAETGETQPLLGEEAKLLAALGSSRHNKTASFSCEPETPVGGIPGNGKFYTNVQLSLRLTTFAMILGTMVWMPSVTESIGAERFAKHAPLAICLMIFFAAPTFGAVVNTASAGIAGAFMAAFNIFMLRGFFPDGVTPGMGHLSTESIVGWTDLALFNLMMLSGNFRPGFKITGMALNCGFMMCFLNPEDQTVFSKNFKINPNGAAVSAFLGTCCGSVSAILAVLLPYPLGWATTVMKSGSKAASEDTCKLFLAAVDYFKGSSANVLIDRQLSQAKILKAQVGALGGNIDAAYIECLDMGREGTSRNLFLIHSTMMGKIYDILNALQIAMHTEDFGPSHKDCMDTIGDASAQLVDETCVLLMACTNFSEDGDISADEAKELEESEKKVQKCVEALAKDFEAARKKFGKPISKELMGESFFVFCLSAFARLVIDFSTQLRKAEKLGEPVHTAIINGITGIVKPPLPYHFRICSRYWLSLLSCFAFAVFIDNYSPSCAITAVFLINTRVGPDIMAMINGLLSVVVGVVCNALMYSFSCKYGDTTVLMIVSVFYWSTTIFVAYGGSSLAGIGLIMAALAPFAILKDCAATSAAAEAASAVGLWGTIRALLIAVVVTVFWEIVHIPGWFTAMATDKLDTAFEGVSKAFDDVFEGRDVTEALEGVSGALGDAETYNAAAIMEPRFWWCRWKKEFLLETTDALNKVRLDIMVMRLALCGSKEEVGPVCKKLKQVESCTAIEKDLTGTLHDAHKLTISLLRHTNGPFPGLDDLESVEGLDELEGLDEAITGINKIVEFPKKTPSSMEDDQLVQLSIVFNMLQYMITRIAAITKGAVKLS